MGDVVREIRSSWDCTIYNHRGSLDCCPFCQFEQKIKEWHKQASILVVAEIQGVHRSVAIVTECPKCFEKSWVHIEMSFSTYDSCYSKSWIEAIRKEYDKRCLSALREWKKGICGECALLTGGEITTHAWSLCDGRSGGVEIKCDRFQEIL